MNYQEIENCFNDEQGLNTLLEKLKETFDRVDYYANLFKQRVIAESPVEVKNALSELTGIFMFLKPIVAIAHSEKKNREVRAYETYRLDFENNPPVDDKGKQKKFTSAVAEKIANDKVANYRAVRNTIEAYLNACDKAISTCQSLLKYMTEELHKPN